MSGRRLITVPGYLVGWLLWLAAAPIWIPAAAVSDLIRRNGAIALRSAAVVTVYLTCEALGILASGAIWAWRGFGFVDDERWVDLHFRLESWWATTIFRSVVSLFGLELEVEGRDDAARGPYLLLVRHASAGDTLLAASLLGNRHGMRLRYVLKRELLWDPCLDIVGNRLPNVFVDRFSSDSTGEIRNVQALATGLGQRDAVLIYPEGSRFTRTKRARAIDRFERRGDSEMSDYAASLDFVLPPRLGGVLGLLEAAPDADIVICSHTGFEGAASLQQIWTGALLGKRVHVQFRRIRRDKVPSSKEARAQWILEEWRKVDAFVAKHIQLESSSP